MFRQAGMNGYVSTRISEAFHDIPDELSYLHFGITQSVTVLIYLPEIKELFNQFHQAPGILLHHEQIFVSIV